MKTLFDHYCGMDKTGPDGRRYTIHTQQIIVEPGIGAKIADVGRPFLGDQNKAVAVIVDENTLEAAGREVIASLERAGRPYKTLHMEPKAGKKHVVCDDAVLDAVTQWLGDQGVVGTISVGSGTISDLGKMGSHRAGIPDVSVGTAPSNNGYTSAIAAILSEGVKTTQPCTPAIACFADPDVMCHAPYRMIASGIGDLYSKPVSNADWRLGYRLNDSFFSPIVMQIVDAGNELLVGVAPRLPDLDIDAVGRLTGAIMLSGLGMQAAGSSGPASGGEHLVSHYLDMTADRDGEPYDLHGCQVAVGTCFTASLYDQLTRLDPATIDVEARVRALPAWPDYAELLTSRFEDLAPAVLNHAERAYPTPDVLRARLERLVGDWDDIIAWVGETLRAPNDLADELDSANCPTRFPQIGVSQARAVRAVLHCKDIRNRYTILHLLWELGLLEEWGQALVNAQF